MTPGMEIILIGATVAVACSLLGVFLVLRKVALLSDAISHAILLGIVLGFFIAKDITSPLLIIGAALTGLLTVLLTESIITTKKVKEDTAIGLVFPALFSLGVILITRYAGSTHLDVDAVLLGELAFAPFNRLTLFGLDVGPKGLWVMGIILLLNLLFILLFYKELKLTVFDPALAASLGFSAVFLNYATMLLVSVTAVGAFDAVGSVLVVALFIAPPATAYLLTRRLSTMLWLSALFGVVSAAAGYWLAYLVDASIAGAMAIMTGLLFLGALIFSPQQGLLTQLLSHRKKRYTFAMHMLLVHLSAHQGKPDERKENTLHNAKTHMRWKPRFANRVALLAEKELFITKRGDHLSLTAAGKRKAADVMFT